MKRHSIRYYTVIKIIIIRLYEANKIDCTNSYFLFLENEPINKHPNARSFSITTPPTTPIEINVDGSCCQASLVCPRDRFL